MVIIEDTRNQPGKHKNINAYMERCGHRVIRSKMLVGDPISRVKAETLYKQIHTMSSRYGVEFRFCRRDETGKMIANLLLWEEQHA